MNVVKAIISAVLLYALIFLAASALMFVVAEPLFSAVTLLIVALLTFVVAKYYYFKRMRVVNPIKEGLLLGIVLVLVSLAIEIPVMVYGFKAGEGWNWLMKWNIMLGYLLMLVVPVLAVYKK